MLANARKDHSIPLLLYLYFVCQQLAGLVPCYVSCQFSDDLIAAQSPCSFVYTIYLHAMSYMSPFSLTLLHSLLQF